MLPKFTMKPVCLACGLLFLGATHAQSSEYMENFSGSKTQLSWAALGKPNKACLTANGNGPNNTGTLASIPTCTTASKSPLDPAGYGALRLTTNMTYQTGGILSNFDFPTDQGIQITFTTYTYNGDKGGPAANGADGIVFILTDGSKPMPVTSGGSGGAMGYSCSNANVFPYEGMANAYLGLGIDEYGNFLNKLDNTNTGIAKTSANSWGSGQYQPERIGLRGAGNTTWAWLQSKNSTYYSGGPTDALTDLNSTQKAKFYNACKTGTYITSSGTAAPIDFNYNAISGGYYVLPSNQPIASNTGLPRVNANGTANPGVHPITYKLSISPSGLLNFSFSYNNGTYQQVLSNRQITNENGPLPSSFRFGFTAGTGGSHNVHEITCFKVAPTISNSSAEGNTVSNEVQIGSQIYLASYTDNDWTGTVQAVPVTVNDSGDISLSPTPKWDAGCVLAGGVCNSTKAGNGTTNAAGSYSPAPKPGDDTTGNSRVLLTSDSSTGAGLPFRIDSLDAAEKTALGTNTATQTAAVAWLRGDRSNEQLWGNPPGTLRARTAGVLGDIINSSPTWVGPPQPDTYPDTLKDSITTATGPETAYSGYVTSAASRQSVVYVGSNDGFLHGFRTGDIDVDYAKIPLPASAKPNDGLEVLGFMPSGQLKKYAAGLTSSTYSHSYVVDATPGVGDLFYGGAWHTWLVGGVGSAGQEIYALDITDPSQFAESKAGSLVIGDWTASASLLKNLNCTVGTPMIVRLHNGQWAIIFGNGLPNANDTNTCKQQATGGAYTSGIYIGLVDPTNGEVTFAGNGIGTDGFLSTGAGASASPNGIAEIASVDIDDDGIVDYVYGGDLLGNVWRFDLTASTASNWTVSTFGAGGSAKPLFTAVDSTGKAQPITTAPIVATMSDADTSKPRVMVYFGTGRFTPATTSGAATYAAGPQAFYGIWDWDWSTTKWKDKFANLATSPGNITTASLRQQTATQTATTRDLSTNPVCWADSCASGTKHYGWYFKLPDTAEQIIYNPTTVGAVIVVNTAEPPAVNAQACNPGQQTGWTMAFDPGTGGTANTNGFFTLRDPASNTVTGHTDGVYRGAVGTPIVVRHNGRTWLVTQTANGVPATVEVDPPPPKDPPSTSTPPRASWRELKL